MGVLFAPFLRVSPKIVPPEREPTILGETFGTRARGRPRTAPPRRRHVMPLAMRPRSDQMAHCRRTLRLPNAIDTPCNNRYTFGAALRDLTGAPAGKISDFSRGARGAALKRASPCERLVSGSTKDVTLKLFVRPSPKENHRAQRRSELAVKSPTAAFYKQAVRCPRAIFG